MTPQSIDTRGEMDIEGTARGIVIAAPHRLATIRDFRWENGSSLDEMSQDQEETRQVKGFHDDGRHRLGGMEGGKEGRKEGRIDGRIDGRKEGRIGREEWKEGR